MKDIFRSKSLKALDAEIERLTKTLSCMEPDNDKYAPIVDNLKVLCDAREKKNPMQISADTLWAIGANIVGLLIVLNFERGGIITSKAIGMLWKGKS